MRDVISELKGLYRSLSLESLTSLGEVYADEIVFQDPICRVRGLTNLTSYFEKTMGNLTLCEFEFHSEFLMTNSAALEWNMAYAHPRLNKGRTLNLKGMSVLEFDNKVKFHRDYYDAGALLYEHVPLLGTIIRGVKSRL